MIYPSIGSSCSKLKSSHFAFTRTLSLPKQPYRAMASVVDSIPHTVRTAKDPRQAGLYDVTLSRIEQVNSRIRLLRLSLPRDGVRQSNLVRASDTTYLDSLEKVYSNLNKTMYFTLSQIYIP